MNTHKKIMDAINSVTTTLLEYYRLILTVLLECIGILCQFSKLDWFVKPPRTTYSWLKYKNLLSLLCYSYVQLYACSMNNLLHIADSFRTTVLLEYIYLLTESNDLLGCDCSIKVY